VCSDLIKRALEINIILSAHKNIIYEFMSTIYLFFCPRTKCFMNHQIIKQNIMLKNERANEHEMVSKRYIRSQMDTFIFNLTPMIVIIYILYGHTYFKGYRSSHISLTFPLALFFADCCWDWISRDFRANVNVMGNEEKKEFFEK
jgi:hypothetical protein